MRFGKFFARVRRERLQLSLREFCRRFDFDPSNLSKLERGKLPPPQSHDKLEVYAQALGLEEGSDEWYEFFDLAAAERGELPKEILEDEEVYEKLPVLFRTLRGEDVDDEQLEKLIDLIKRS